MFNKSLFAVTMLVLMVFFSGCLRSNHKSTKTSIELQAIQKKEFETSYKIAFASILSVFQDKGFIINTADSNTGLITASSPRNNSQGFGYIEINYTKATAFVESMPSKKTSIRLNFVDFQKTSSDYGMEGGNSLPIEDGVFYQGIFEKIQKAIFVRTNR